MNQNLYSALDIFWSRTLMVNVRARILVLAMLCLACINTAHARILFTNELFENEADTATIDADGNATGQITLRFGSVINESLQWVVSSARFFLSDSLTIDGVLDTNGNTITLDADNAGTGANVSLIANQGSEPDGILRYNTTTNQWEIANDGVTFNAISTAGALNAFIQNGNSFGTTATIGTNDNNVLAFEVNNSERMRINTAGDVGIGATTIPANKKLTVSNDAAPTFNAGGNGMGVSMAGGGGIYMKNSTDNVEAKFESYGSAVQVGVSGNVQAPLLLSYRNDQPGARLDTTGHFSIGYTNNTLPGTGGPNRLTVRDAVAGNSDVGRLENDQTATANNGASMLFAANRTTGGMTNIASIGGLISDIANAAYKGVLVFRTANNAAPAERMRIDHLGRVGINTTSLSDLFTVAQSTATDSISAIRAEYTQTSNAANITGQALHVLATASGQAGDTLRGILIDSITGTSSVEHALTIGQNWDHDIVFQDTTPSIQMPDNFQFTVTTPSNDVPAVIVQQSNNQTTVESDILMAYNSVFQEEFIKDLPDLTADRQRAWGDNGQLSVDENTACTFSVLDDIVGGVGRILNGTANHECLASITTAAGNPQLIFSRNNLPTVLMKVRASNASANDDLWAGLSDITAAANNMPFNNGIYFYNNNSGNWVGATESGGSTTNVNCGVAISATNFALLKIEVVSTTSVRFSVDANAADGVNFTVCGTSTTNIPAGNMGFMIGLASTSANRSIDVDFARVWQR